MYSRPDMIMNELIPSFWRGEQEWYFELHRSVCVCVCVCVCMCVCVCVCVCLCVPFFHPLLPPYLTSFFLPCPFLPFSFPSLLNFCFPFLLSTNTRSLCLINYLTFSVRVCLLIRLTIDFKVLENTNVLHSCFYTHFLSMVSGI
jgi:hypothetical protein